MASIVATYAGSGTGTAVSAAIAAVGAGHSIIIAAHILNAAGAVTVVDNAGGSFGLDYSGANFSGNGTLRFYSRSAASGGPTQVTINQAVSATVHWFVYVVDSALDATARLNLSGRGSGWGTGNYVGGTTTEDGCVGILLNQTVDSKAITSDSGWSDLQVGTPGVDPVNFSGHYRADLGGAGYFDMSCSWPAPESDWVAVVVGYLPGTGGGAVEFDLDIDDASHAHSAALAALTASTVLSTADCLHGHAAQTASLSTSLALSTANASHGHTADQATLSTAAVLTIDAAIHAQSAEGLTLSLALLLGTASASHSQSASSLSLSTSGAASLAIADAAHAHAASDATLTSATALAVQNSVHAHAVDGLTLATTGAVSLAVANATHAQGAGDVVLNSSTTLAVASAYQTHATAEMVLSVALDLVVASAAHAHTVSFVDLSGVPSLLIANAAHAHAAGSVALDSLSWLQVADAWHVQLAESVVLQYSGQLTRAPNGGGYRRARTNTIRPRTGNTVRPIR